MAVDLGLLDEPVECRERAVTALVQVKSVNGWRVTEPAKSMRSDDAEPAAPPPGGREIADSSFWLAKPEHQHGGHDAVAVVVCRQRQHPRDLVAVGGDRDGALVVRSVVRRRGGVRRRGAGEQAERRGSGGEMAEAEA